jgi:hypothetical protein
MSYPAFPSIPRLNKEVIVTEKIDGTNGLIYIPGPDDGLDPSYPTNLGSTREPIYAGSRNRWLTRESDNFGFANWVASRAAELHALLGPGHHYGEWWGKGIQRGYGLDHKRFSLFNATRWAKLAHPALPEVSSVPVLSVWPTFSQFLRVGLDDTAQALRIGGSVASPGFMDPEGIVVFHTAAQTTFKFTLDGDGHKNKRHGGPVAAPDGTGHP